MEKRYMISVEDLKTNGIIHGNTEGEKLGPIILRIQDRIIQKILGTALYVKLLDLIQAYDNGDGTEVPEPYHELLYDYVIPCLIPYVEKRTVTFISWRVRNAGVGKFQDQYYVGSTKQETTDLKQEIEDDILHYHNELFSHLEAKGKEVYPEYVCGQTADGKHNPEAEKKTPLGNLMFIKGGKTHYAKRRNY